MNYGAPNMTRPGAAAAPVGATPLPSAPSAYGSQFNSAAKYGQPMGQQPYSSAAPIGAPAAYNQAPTYGQPTMSQPQMTQPPMYGAQAGGYAPSSFQQAGGAPYQQAGAAPFQQAGGAPYQQAGAAPYQQAPYQQAGAPYQQAGAPYQQAGAAPYQQAGAPMMGMGAPMGGMAMGGPVSLVKGGNMSLTKAVANLRQVTVGLGWDVRQTPGAPFDLDASVFLLKGDGKVRMPQDLVFYNNKQSVDGSVFHHGDNLTGVGEGDDEQVSIDLTRVPPEIQKIVCVVSIYESEARGQNFGMVSRAFIRVCTSDTKQEIVRFDLTEEASMFNCMVFGELYRYNGEWKFRAIGQGVPGGLRSCGPMFGLAMA